jgi:4-hydroxybenzoate polyprenyltransferase
MNRVTPLDPTDRQAGFSRFCTYQKERFPIFGHGPLILSFSFCAVSLSSLLRGNRSVPPLTELAVAFVTSFIFFLQLRIADEFKDFEEDSKYRPYRPVPRGLVSLRELAVIFALGCGAQALLAVWLHPRLIIILAVVWIYLAAMSKEFFVAEWLRRRPVTYMVTHMAILPLVDLYATSTDWLSTIGRPPHGLIWFLVASFFNGMVIEIGRKIRSPQDEETGVQTYSVVWGRRGAVLAWLAAMTLTLTFATLAARAIHFAWFVTPSLGLALAIAIVIGVSYLRSPLPGVGKRFELASGLWTLLLYLSLGLAPLFLGN